MSLFMFLHEEESILVMTDTLATTPEGDPHLFTTKCWSYPHLDLVMATTGLANLGELWAARLQSGMLARDIDMVHLHAPAAIRSAWKELEDEFGDLPSTATIYHLGTSERTGAMVRCTYRSEDNFAGEYTTETGFGVKPQPEDGLTEVPASLEEMIELAQSIRNEQDRLPAADRVSIGGDLVLTFAQSGTVGSRKVHRFTDYEQVWLAMNASLG